MKLKFKLSKMRQGQRVIQAAVLVAILYFYIPATETSSRGRSQEVQPPQPVKVFEKKKFLAKSSKFFPLWDRTPTVLAPSPIAFNETTPAIEVFMEGVALYNQGNNEVNVTLWRQAIEKWEEAQALGREESDGETESLALSLLGSVYTKLGEFDRAEAAYLEVLPLYQDLGDDASEANVLYSLADVYAKVGKYQEAIDTYTKARPLWQQVNYRTGEALTLKGLGSVFAKLGDPEQALNFYEEALPVAREVNEGKGYEASILNSIANAYTDLGEPQQALETYNQVLALWEPFKNEAVTQWEALRGEASTLNNLGWTYLQLEQYQNALTSSNQALTLWQQIGDRASEASSLNTIGIAYANLGDADKALDFYNQALPLRQSTGDRAGVAFTLYHIARIERDRGNLEVALIHIETAIETIESLRVNVASQELRTTYFASVQDLYEFYIDLLMQLHQQQPDAGYDAKALQASEGTRARSLLEILRESGTDIRQGVDAQMSDRERSLQQQINALAGEQATLLSGEHTEDQAVALRAELQTLFRELDTVQGQIRASSPKYADLTQPQPLGLEEIQEQVLDEETLLLEYFLGKERSYVWVVSEESIASYELPSRGDIELAIREFRTVMTSPRRRNQPDTVAAAVTALSEKVLFPVADGLDRKRLAIVSDGPLQYAPFSALSKSAHVKPLAMEHEIVMLPSASTIASMRSELDNRESAPKTVAMIADPVFEASDDRLQDVWNTQGNLVASLQNALLVASARDIGLAIPPSRLPGTEQEAQEILALVPEEDQRMQAFGLDANRQVATSEELRQYRMVHFATHGFLNSTHPGLSGLVLSLVDGDGNPQNGFLRLHDLYNLNLPADLAVLSACQTGLGKTVKGEGVVGLTRGFMYAGVPRVVVSLWSVDDRGTAALMSVFYRKMLQDKLSPSAALREAQIELYQQEEWQSPYYWAAFEIQGEWRGN